VWGTKGGGIGTAYGFKTTHQGKKLKKKNVPCEENAPKIQSGLRKMWVFFGGSKKILRKRTTQNIFTRGVGS